jgi:hypothetical protein
VNTGVGFILRMLDLPGRPPVLMTLEGEGPGGFNANNKTAMWTGVAGFLEANVDTAPSTAAQNSQ